MPDTSGFSGAPVPIGAEALDGPGNFAAFRAAIDDRVVLYASSQSNRDTLYANVRKGAIVSCPELGIAWQKKTSPPTAADWRVVCEVGTAVTSGVVTAATDFAVASQWAQRINGVLYMRAALTYSGATLTGASNGNLPDTTVCTLQSAWQPPSAALTWPVSLTTGFCTLGGYIVSGGVVQFTTGVPNGTVSSGDTVRFSVAIPGA